MEKGYLIKFLRTVVLAKTHGSHCDSGRLRLLLMLLKVVRSLV